MSDTFTKREVALLGEYIKEGYSLDNAIILLRGNPAAAVPAQGCVNPNGILADIVQRWNDLKRDEGAFPPGDRRAAMSEHRLWHAIQAAKAWLSAFPSTDRGTP